MVVAANELFCTINDYLDLRILHFALISKDSDMKAWIEKHRVCYISE